MWPCGGCEGLAAVGEGRSYLELPCVDSEDKFTGSYMNHSTFLHSFTYVHPAYFLLKHTKCDFASAQEFSSVCPCSGSVYLHCRLTPVLQDTYSVQPSSGSLKRIIYTSPLPHWNLSTHTPPPVVRFNEFSFQWLLFIIWWWSGWMTSDLCKYTFFSILTSDLSESPYFFGNPWYGLVFLVHHCKSSLKIKGRVMETAKERECIVWFNSCALPNLSISWEGTF